MSIIKLLDMDKFSKNLKKVTTNEIFITKGTYHPDGLFSESIFGNVGTSERDITFSFVDLNVSVIHPALISIIKRISRNLIKVIKREGYFTISNDGQVIPDENGTIHGMTSIVDNIDKIKFQGGTPQRENLVEMLDYYIKNKRFFINKIPIIPPTYRDIVINSQGNQEINELNNYYLPIISLSIQLSSIPKGIVFDVLSANMQQKVNDLYDFISSKISKKQGIIRHDILGKRVDFSARTVIIGAGNELKSDEIGIPFMVSVKIFEPFLLYELINSKYAQTIKETFSRLFYEYNQSELSISSLRSLINGINNGDELPPELEKIIKVALHRVIQDKVVIAKRDPVLHSEGTMAFKPVLVEGKSSKINPLYCSGYNADFDGDQMALFVPLTNESIQEVKERMITVNSKDGMNHSSINIDKDTIAGLFALTKNPRPLPKSFPPLKNETLLTEFDIYKGFTYNGEKTTVGRIMFNKYCLPSKYPFINKPIDSSLFSKINNDIFNRYNTEIYRKFCEESLKLGFKYYMLAPTTFALEDLEIPNSLKILKQKLNNATPEESQKILDQIEKELKQYLSQQDGGLSIVAESGTAKGGIGQLRQVLVARGMIADIEGNILPTISQSYSDGLNSKEFFNVSPGTRKGIVDRVLNTATTGYLARQLIFACQSVEVDTRINDCKTTRTLDIVVTPDIASRLTGRYVVNSEGNFRLFNIKTDINKLIKLRSPMFCQTKKLCLTCYGQLVLRNNSPYVGITAASIVGERGTQLIMRTFHTGGAVSIEKIDLKKIITDNIEPQLKNEFDKSFIQKDNSIISNVDGTIIIDKSNFLDPKNDIENLKDNINLTYGYFNIKLVNLVFDISLDYITVVSKYHGTDSDDNVIIIPFKSGETIFTCKTNSNDFTQSVKIIEAILSGRKAWKDGKHFLMKVFDHYVKLTKTKADFVHFETLCSNLLRDKDNPRIAARLNRKVYQPVVVNIKQIPQLESWLSGLEFEQFNKSIENALVYPKPEEASILEKILIGDF